jgi:mannose-6-phosphate isomerase-like protein (cupin superfamily)
MSELILGPGEGERLVLHGANVMTFKATGSDTGGNYSLCHYEAVPGWPGPELHIHEDFEEAFYVLEGEFDFRIGERSVRAGPGAFLLVPRGVPHAFSNPTDARAILLGIFSPSGAEDHFRRRAADG